MLGGMTQMKKLVENNLPSGSSSNAGICAYRRQNDLKLTGGRFIVHGLRGGGHHLRQPHKLPSSRVSTGPRSQFQSELSSLPTPNRGTSARPHNCGNETGYIPGRWSSPSVTGRIVCRERSDCNSPHHVENPAARNGCKTGYESAVNHPQVTCPIHPISVPTTIKRQHASTHRTAVLDRTE